MGDLRAEVLLTILRSESSWDKKTKELRYKYALDTFWQAKEYLFMERVTGPLYSRFTATLRKITPPEFREAHFEWDKDCWGKDEGGYLLCQCDDPDCPMEDIAWRLSERVDWKTQDIWMQEEEWQWEEPTLEEFMSFGLTMNDVPTKAKEFRDGSVQPALF